LYRASHQSGLLLFLLRERVTWSFTSAMQTPGSVWQAGILPDKKTRLAETRPEKIICTLVLFWDFTPAGS
jgi:hypothetical protein